MRGTGGQHRSNSNEMVHSIRRKQMIEYIIDAAWWMALGAGLLFIYTITAINRF